MVTRSHPPFSSGLLSTACASFLELFSSTWDLLFHLLIEIQNRSNSLKSSGILIVLNPMKWGGWAILKAGDMSSAAELYSMEVWELWHWVCSCMAGTAVPVRWMQWEDGSFRQQGANNSGWLSSGPYCPFFWIIWSHAFLLLTSYPFDLA